MKETLAQLKIMAGDMVDLIDSLDLSGPIQPENSREQIDSDENGKVVDPLYPVDPSPEGVDILSKQEVKKIEEVKSITPIKSIQEVVGIYPLTEAEAQKLKELNGGRKFWRRHRR